MSDVELTEAERWHQEAVRLCLESTEHTSGTGHHLDEGSRAMYLFERGETHPEPTNPYRPIPPGSDEVAR